MSETVIAGTPDAVLMNKTKLSILQALVDGFASIAGFDAGEHPDDFPIHMRLTLGDWRRAREVLRNERAQIVIDEGGSLK